MRTVDFNVKHWIDADGKTSKEIKLSDYPNQFKVIFCFQSWCPGCHQIGFPSLQQLTQAFTKSDNIAFFAIQTVFEGFNENTADQIVELQQRYDLKIPFGHDAGDDDKSTANFMLDFHTKGTPWFVLIDQNNNLVFSDFHINVENAIAYIKQEIGE